VAPATLTAVAGVRGMAGWLGAHPAHVRPEINGARLMAYGQALALDASQCEALLRPLRPLFGDAGMLIDAPSPSRWYLRLAPGAQLPSFAGPDEALGADLFEHLPGSTDASSADGRRWRALLSEAQVVLHNHPLNATRAAAGLPTVNSLWFWGAGRLPDHVRSAYDQVASDDDALLAFAALAGVEVAPLPTSYPGGDGAAVFDLRRARDLSRLQADWLDPLLDALGQGRVVQVSLDFADGVAYRLARAHRWRFWRRPLRGLGA